MPSLSGLLKKSQTIEGVHCVAAAIFNQHGYPIAAIHVTGPVARLTAEDFSATAELVRRHADAISGRFGYNSLVNPADAVASPSE